MSRMFNPPHPGEILADTVLREDGGISVTAFAEKLGMTRTAISRGNITCHGKPESNRIAWIPRRTA